MEFIRFDSQDLFNQEIFTGISLFCGAGFSVEAHDVSDQRLPLGIQLLDEIKNKFPKVSNQTRLDRAASILDSSLDKSGFYHFLTDRFTVNRYNSRYNSLLSLKIKNIFTTNIDDLFFKIFDMQNLENRNDIFLNVTYLNGINPDSKAINYSPLHGCVKNSKDAYRFSIAKIATAYTRSKQNAWDNFKSTIMKTPVLFWGWNFEDSDVLTAIYDTSAEMNTHRWVILFQPAIETIEWVESQGFKIIISNTADMLEYISELVETKKDNSNDLVCNTVGIYTQEYGAPRRETLLSIPFERFFTEYDPDWFHIYSRNIAKTHWYSVLENDIATGEDIIVYGIPGCGKTTLLRQLLIGYNGIKKVHLLESPQREKVEAYIKWLPSSENSVLFVDDCFRDSDALVSLFAARNIQVIGFSRDYNYERQNFRLNKHKYISRDITTLTEQDAANIIETVPNIIRNDRVSQYTRNDLTMVVLFPNMVKYAGNFRFIRNFYNQDAEAAEVFVLICYVHACGIPASFDMIYSYLGDENYNYKQMYDIIARAGGLIKDHSNNQLGIYTLSANQDYYDCRSRFLAEKILGSTISSKRLFGNVLMKFAEKIPVFKICAYDVFRRRGYDADWAFKAFASKKESGDVIFYDNGDGERYYTVCAESDNSEYIYQQAALYFAKMKLYKTAYEWIDKAKNFTNYDRFSINNTEAQIKFDANFGLDLAYEELTKSLNTMRESCESDRRKHIHFCSFAEYAIRFCTKYNDDVALEYLRSAQKYVIDALEGDSSMRIARDTRYRLNRLNYEISRLL